MTYISPLLQARLNVGSISTKAQTPNNQHEKIYEDLQKRANEVKPNEAKAQMVNEGMMGNPITATKDMFKDAKNFVTAVKTGEMGDNNLGRMNDLGLKIGALLTAGFLALHSKTKTEAIMKFVGGGAFVASMSLWPKLFINLPARLVHGFRIDNKYISAQGDKKDFFLDNQFLVWDAYPEEQLRKDAQNAGIDYDSPNGKEKIQRKMQKTALQNRTLWMATAGFATPLMTTMICSGIEPHIKEAVIKHGAKKVENIVDSENGIAGHIKAVVPEVKNAEEIDNLISSYAKEGKAIDEEFYSNLAKIMAPDNFFGNFKDVDDKKVFSGFAPNNLATTLKEIRESGNFSSFEPKNLAELLKDADTMDFDFENLTQAKLNKKAIKGIFDRLNGDYSYKNVIEVLESGEFNISQDAIETIKTSAKIDNAKFFEFIKKYNEGPLSTIKARARAYADLINPVVGSKTESVYTDEFMKTMKKIINTLGYKQGDLLELRTGSFEAVIEKLSTDIAEKTKNMNDVEYAEFIKKLGLDFSDARIPKLVNALKDEKNLGSIINGLEIKGFDDAQINKLTSAIIGQDAEKGGLIKLLQNFIETREVDLKSIRSKILLCANFERRVKTGDLKDLLSSDEINIARKIVYDGTISTAKNNAFTNLEKCEGIVKKIFKEDKFNVENSVVPTIKDTVKGLCTLFTKGKLDAPTKDYLSCGSFADLIKNFATSMSNNKSWAKIFVPMSIAVAAITLLVQPLFGNIKKEFPEENKAGGVK